MGMQVLEKPRTGPDERAVAQGKNQDGMVTDAARLGKEDISLAEIGEYGRMYLLLLAGLEYGWWTLDELQRSHN